MKRRALCLVLALTLLFALSPLARAEKETVTRIAIWVTSPVGGEKPHAPQEVAVEAGGTMAKLDEDSYNYFWREANRDTEHTGNFVNGRAYEIVVTLPGLLADYSVDGDTRFILNGEADDTATLSVTDTDVIYTIPLTAVSGDITPAVSVAKDGKTAKEYDGKDVVLRAAVTNRLNGVSYSYQWFRDDAAMAEADREELTLRNTADSGAYFCRVTASLAGEKKSTDSLPVTVKITPHPVTLILEDAEKNGGDPDPALTYTTMGEIYDPLTGAPAREEGEAEGNYEIGVGTLAFDETVAENYTLTVRTGRFSIVGAGVTAFSALPDVADLSYVVGRSGSHIRVSATGSALPKGAVLTLSTVEEKVRQAFADAAGEKGILKAISVSVTEGDNANASLNKNAVLRLMIPLTEEEERFDSATLTALFRKKSGAVEPLDARVEKDEKTGVTYLVTELRDTGSVALLEGTLLPEEKKDGQEEEPVAPRPRKKGTWLWVLVGLFTAAAAGVAVWTVIRAKKGEEPTKTYVPKDKPAPSPRKATRRPPEEPKQEVRPAGKVISFDDLEDDD